MTREEKISKIIKDNQRIKAMINGQNNLLSQMRDYVYASADVDEAYQRGVNDAWECAKKIAVDSEFGGISVKKLFNIFGTYSYHKVFENYTPQEAIKKIKEYEKQRDAIKVGDEVTMYPGISDDPFVVIKVNEEVIYGIDASGLYRGCARSEADFTKTGRSFPQIAEAMKAMQEDTM